MFAIAFVFVFLFVFVFVFFCMCVCVRVGHFYRLGSRAQNIAERQRILIQRMCKERWGLNLKPIDRLRGNPNHFHLLKTFFFYVPLLVVKGIYPYWTYFFPGVLTNWKTMIRPRWKGTSGCKGTSAN